MTEQLDRAGPHRSRSAFDDFLGRTLVHEDAGARMPRVLVAYALLGAVVTMVIGAFGVSTTQDAAGSAVYINVASWAAAIGGAILILSGLILSRARSAGSRRWMWGQLVAGAVVPGIALLLFALYVVFVAIVVGMILLGIWVWLESL